MEPGSPGSECGRGGNGGIIDDSRPRSLGGEEVLLTVKKGTRASWKGNKQGSFLGWLFDVWGETFKSQDLREDVSRKQRAKGMEAPRGRIHLLHTWRRNVRRAEFSRRWKQRLWARLLGLYEMVLTLLFSVHLHLCIFPYFCLIHEVCGICFFIDGKNELLVIKVKRGFGRGNGESSWIKPTTEVRILMNHSEWNFINNQKEGRIEGR